MSGNQGIFSGDYTESSCFCGKYNKRDRRYSGVFCDKCGGEVIDRNGLVRYLKDMQPEGADQLCRAIFGHNKREAEVFLPIAAYALREVIIKALTPTEFVVISEAYGLFTNEKKDFEEIGKILNIPEDQVRQVEAKSLRQLRHPSCSRQLKDYIHFQHRSSQDNYQDGVNREDEIRNLSRLFKDNKPKYDKFLKDCMATGQSNNARELFSELCYAILAAGVQQPSAKKALDHLQEQNRLFQKDAQSIKASLQGLGYRFPNRTEYICEARARFLGDTCETGMVDLVRKLSSIHPLKARKMLISKVKVKGLKMKSASLFLRNLGLSRNELAILDTHILQWLEKLGIVNDLPRDPEGRIKQPTPIEYREYEKRMEDWNDTNARIPLDVLDLLLWEMGRGDI